MIKLFSRQSAPIDDGRLRDVLRRCDPIEPPASIYVAALESDILAQIDGMMRPPAATDVWMLAGIFRQGWGAQAAAFASVLIVAAGFIAGQAFYGAENAPSLAGGVSLVAFADETPVPLVPSTDASWGDSDENAE